MRIFRHAPWFTAASSLTLAAGIGGVVTVFVVYWAVIVRPILLPFPAASVKRYQ